MLAVKDVAVLLQCTWSILLNEWSDIVTRSHHSGLHTQLGSYVRHYVLPRRREYVKWHHYSTQRVSTAPCVICELTSIIDAGIPPTRHLLTLLLDPLTAALVLCCSFREVQVVDFPVEHCLWRSVLPRLITSLISCCIPREILCGYVQGGGVLFNFAYSLIQQIANSRRTSRASKGEGC